MYKRFVCAFVCFCAIAGAFTVSVYAENVAIELPREFSDALESLPDDISDSLPDKLYSEDSETVYEGLSELVSVEYLFGYVEDLLFGELREAVVLLGKLSGILLIAALFSVVRDSFGAGSIGTAFGFCSTCAVFAAISGLMYGQISMVSKFFERLTSLLVGFIPISCAVWAMGGNVGTASSAAGTLYCFLAVCEGFCAKTVIPICSICIAFALCRGISPSVNLGAFASSVKKTYTFILGFIMTLLLAVLSMQTILGSAADGIGAKSAKLLTASVIPIVGGSVSDTLKTVGASVQYVKSIVGVGGIVLIVILVLPTLISLIFARFVFMISGSIAELLGCEREGKLIGELGNAEACMLATVSMSSVMFVLALNIFVKSAVAIG